MKTEAVKKENPQGITGGFLLCGTKHIWYYQATNLTNFSGDNVKTNRRKSRENAFSLLFEWSFHGDDTDTMLKHAVEGRELEIDDFARQLCTRAIENHETIDALIESYSETWKLSRLSKVTLAVLRLAFCELTLFDDIPLGATVNEAVELCKKYAGEEEASYVNGILGQYGRDKKTAPKEENNEALS